MPSPIQKVNPGDLITSEFMNHLLDRIDNLEERVARIESEGAASGAVVILDILPEGIVRVGDEMRLIGRNFGLRELIVVTLAGKRIEQFKSGSDSTLVFDVPPIVGINEQGQPVLLTLNNPQGFASQTVMLANRPQTLPKGEIHLSLSKPPAGKLIPDGSTYSFVFALTAFSNMDETFILEPSLDVGWPVAVVGPTGALGPKAEFFIHQGGFPEGTKLSVTVQVTIPSTASIGTLAHLQLTSKSKINQEFINSSASLPLIVGEASSPAPAFSVSLISVREGSVQGEFVVVPADTPDFLLFRADVPKGSYSIKLAISKNPHDLWKIESRMTPPDSFTADQPGFVDLNTRLTGKTGAEATDLVVTVISTTNPAVFGEMIQRIKLA
ncbi:IPT/TIG domain-containing protein [Corallococcus exiguus]|uniref:IPT/TIG domain-containing protein n=1 Tax=Corallococcus exiguus TaxID=83462 RepID=A0A7X4YH70_9BACT|nr:IPT/TIG domain-containing protein [Corallococcus exiguus]NBC45348.1 hypothetical protein [Corallococcus exiguus]TNV53197.1 hypothetical protein FH620_36395 [Corallococcus exiguus]